MNSSFCTLFTFLFYLLHYTFTTVTTISLKSKVIWLDMLWRDWWCWGRHMTLLWSLLSTKVVGRAVVLDCIVLQDFPYFDHFLLTCSHFRGYQVLYNLLINNIRIIVHDLVNEWFQNPINSWFIKNSCTGYTMHIFVRLSQKCWFISVFIFWSVATILYPWHLTPIMLPLIAVITVLVMLEFLSALLLWKIKNILKFLQNYYLMFFGKI